MSEYVIGLDVGTSLTKAALFDRSGREIVATGQRSLVSSPRPSWFEMVGEALFAAAATSCRDLMTKAGVNAQDVKDLAISAVMIGGRLIEDPGALMRPDIFWNDGRSQSLLDRLAAKKPTFDVAVV